MTVTLSTMEFLLILAFHHTNVRVFFFNPNLSTNVRVFTSVLSNPQQFITSYILCLNHLPPNLSLPFTP